MRLESVLSRPRRRNSHLSVAGVKPGQRVTRGQAVGEVGMTGVSTAPHLHFELWDEGVQVDPATAIPALSHP